MDRLANLEFNYKATNRFTRVSELHDRYTGLKEKANLGPWKNFMKAYERWSYQRKDGGSDPNWGQFRGKVDKIIETFEALVTERQHWAKMTPIRQFPKDRTAKGYLDKGFIADKITSEFHELCIRQWTDKEEQVRLTLFDMVMFAKGIEMWETPHGPYPESVPVDRVFPDSKAGMNPKKWDLCFVEKQYTPVELYAEIEDEERAELLGWRKKSVLRLLKQIQAHESDSSTHGITDTRDNNEFEFSAEDDLKITVVMAYVKEYKADEDGNQVTMYMMVHNSHIRVGDEDKRKENSNAIGFLRVHDGIAKHLGEVFSVKTHQVARNYYKCPSEAEMVYTACKFYDQGINRTIRAAFRNMALMLKSSNQDQQEKIKNLDTDEAIVLDPDVDILQQQTHQDIKGVVETIRQVMIDTDKAANIDQSAGSQNVKGRAITAREAQIQNADSSSSQKKDIRLYTLAEKRQLTEMYRRFVDFTVPGDEGYEMSELFKERMKDAGISPKNYAPENVLIEPVFFNFGEPPQQIIEKAQLRLQSLRQLSTSTTPGEQRTIRDIIAATSTYQDAESYMERSQYEEFILESVIKAGIENQMMSDPYLNRKNIHVSSGDKHMIEIPIHLEDVEYKLNNAVGLLENIENTPEENAPILLDDITDIVVAMDNQAAHIEAHIMLAERDQLAEGELSAFKQKLQEQRQKERAIETQLSIIQQSRVQSNREKIINDEKTRHLMQTNQESERHTAEKNRIDQAKTLSKFQFALDAQARKAEQDDNLKKQSASIDIAKQSIKDQQELAANEQKSNNKGN